MSQQKLREAKPAFVRNVKDGCIAKSGDPSSLHSERRMKGYSMAILAIFPHTYELNPSKTSGFYGRFKRGYTMGF